ncbi:MAG: glycosyltransferase [Acidimicrobiia bacterium]
MTLHQVDIQALDPERLEELVGPERAERFEGAAAAARSLLDGRRVVNVNSTASGGGVAELLQTLLAYVRGVGIDAHWVVIEGDPEFFAITKRIHNHLYGSTGDGGPLGREEHVHYEDTLRRNAAELESYVRAGDVVILHDPQTAGLADAMHTSAARVVWRCHVGRDTPNHATEVGWAFLREYLDPADAFVFTRAEFAPDWIDRSLLHEIMPSIDPFCAKNEPLSPGAAQAILQYVGLLGGDGDASVASFVRRDGSPGRVERRVDILQTGPPPPPETPLVVQLSRWDRIKDMEGVLHAFATHVDRSFGAHLMLVGPVVHGVTDDPEGGTVLDECVDAWQALPHSARTRIHLACVPMQDPDEGAIIVNALQRHATVVTQKSLAEGFGLTVVEAMWKRRPVVATRVGGIVNQIVDGESGLLVDDPHDLDAFGAAVNRLLADPALAERIGANAYERAHWEFLGDSHLEHYAGLFASLLAPDKG